MLWFVYIFILGLVIGSFANVVIFRVPIGRSIVNGRSMCPNCGKRIAWQDLLPVISFFILKFHCRQCGKSISWLYPAIELYSGIIFMLSFNVLGYAGIINWLSYVFILELLLILAVIDFKNFILPDSIMVVMFLGVLVYAISEFVFGWHGLFVFSATNFVGAAVLFSALFIIWFLSKGKWIGLGDSKLVGLVGLVFGLWGGLIIFYGAIIVGTVIGLFLVLSHRANLKTRLPLGTLICLSATAYIFLGEIIIERIRPIFFSVPFILR